MQAPTVPLCSGKQSSEIERDSRNPVLCGYYSFRALAVLFSLARIAFFNDGFLRRSSISAEHAWRSRKQGGSLGSTVPVAYAHRNRLAHVGWQSGATFKKLLDVCLDRGTSQNQVTATRKDVSSPSLAIGRPSLRKLLAN
jgi:hypothetical protein